MTLPNFQNSLYQPLFMDFLLYTEGIAGFDGELLMRIADNLTELVALAENARINGDFEPFYSCSTKVYHIVRKINQPLLLNALDDLMTDFSSAPEMSKVEEFINLAEAAVAEIRQNLEKI